MPRMTILIGAQWGDEGKGRWIDILAKDADIVARYQGGNNAGHTLYIQGEKIVLHQVPSGAFHEGQVACLGAGVVINPLAMQDELEKIKKIKGKPLTPESLWLSARAHVITPWSIEVDGLRESSLKQPIGTTKRGIGPTYADKAARLGIRLGHFIKSSYTQKWLEARCEQDENFKRHYQERKQEWQSFIDSAKVLAPFVCDVEGRLVDALADNKHILVEGAQGALLDIDHGTYPFVTSSGTGVGGAFQSLGAAGRKWAKVIGVAKAYTTRVGEGPMPTELHDEAGRHLASKGAEFGATTGRPRRCGWLDAVALKYVCQLSGLDGLILNKFDILSGLEVIRVAVAYEHPKLGRLDRFPWDHEVLADCKPVYRDFAGWKGDIPTQGHFSDLPPQALHYITAIEELVGTRVMMVGTGVTRQDAVFPNS